MKKYKGNTRIIVDLLERNPQGLTRDDLIRESGASSTTVVRVVAQLKAEGKIESKHIYRLKEEKTQSAEETARQILAFVEQHSKST